MTLEQLRIFIAVAEREHVTQAAAGLNISKSVASSVITVLEARYNVPLFNRVGRGVELTDAGRFFLNEARAVVARAARAELALLEISELKRGNLRIVASQMIAGYWLPKRIASFHRQYPMIELSVAIANTACGARMVREGDAELGFVQGDVEDAALTQWAIGVDRMVLVGSQVNDTVTNDWLRAAPWIIRETGSETRALFEHAVRDRGIDPKTLNVVMTLPSNEAVLAAVKAGAGFTLLSDLIVSPYVKARTLHALPLVAPSRPLFGLRPKEHHCSRAAAAFLDLIATYTDHPDWLI